MSHYNIIVIKDQIKTQSALKADISLDKLITKIEQQGGPLNCFKGDAYQAAASISKNKIVNNVIVIHISETACGVWRNGVKS